MKKLMIVAFSLGSLGLFAAAAHAGNVYYCTALGSQAKYSFVLDPIQASEEGNQAGSLKVPNERALRSLSCQEPPARAGRHTADRTIKIAECTDKNEPGYRVTVKTRGIAGGVEGIVSFVGKDGVGQLQAILRCQLQSR